MYSPEVKGNSVRRKKFSLNMRILESAQSSDSENERTEG